MTGTRPFLPYGRQTVDDADIAAVTAVLRGDWLTQGPVVTAFERTLSSHVGAAEAVACANGTAALRLAYAALGIGAGDAVIVPSNTFLATASAAHHAGAEVAFADVDPITGLMGVEHAQAALTRARAAGWRPRVVAPVHYAGQTAAMAALGRWARDENLTVVEDACHAVGAVDRDGSVEIPVGACAHSVLTVFSFHPVKTIAAGEGGAVTGQDPVLMERVRRLCNHGIRRAGQEGTAMFANPVEAYDQNNQPNPWYYEMEEPGFNHRLSDIHAALALSQLGRIAAFIERRAALMARYADRLASLSPLVKAPVTVPWCRPAWHLCAVRIDFATARRSRARVMTALRAQAIGSQVHYIPVHRQPYWQRRYGSLSLPGAEQHYAQTLSLPLYPSMTDDDVDRVIGALEVALMGAGGTEA